MKKPYIKDLTPPMRVAWQASSLIFIIGVTWITKDLITTGGSLALFPIMIVLFACSVGVILLRLFFQQRATLMELFRDFTFRRKP